MILFRLFFTFFKIGLFTFGGGYAMISLVREQMLAQGWLTEEEILNMIAVAESTPGPIAVNMATFAGSTQAGFWGSVCATLGVILPSFMIILLIAALIHNLMKYKGVQAFLSGVRPCVVGLILGTALTLLLSTVLGFESPETGFAVDLRGLILLVIVATVGSVAKKIRKKPLSAIYMILISAGLGIVLYSF